MAEDMQKRLIFLKDYSGHQNHFRGILQSDAWADHSGVTKYAEDLNFYQNCHVGMHKTAV